MRAISARNRGFTLVELMITVAIMAILAAIAVPSYTGYMTRARRSAAEQLVMQIASKEQQYIVDARAYTATIGTGGLNISSQDGWTCAATCTNGSYTVSVAIDNTATPPTYAITATPVTGSSQAADGVITYNNTGTKARTVSGVDKGW
jgi:type IV pilus assembly protein PilE